MQPPYRFIAVFEILLGLKPQGNNRALAPRQVDISLAAAILTVVFCWPTCPYNICLQQFSCRQTTVETLHATSLQGLGYGDVVHQFEKRCIILLGLTQYHYIWCQKLSFLRYCHYT